MESVSDRRLSAVVLPPTDSVDAPALFTVTSLKVCEAAVPLIDCAPDPLKVRSPFPGVKVPPLLTQLPATLIPVAVPAENVPEVKVKPAFKFSTVVLPPTARVCAVLATAMPLNVWAAAVPPMV